MEVIVYNSSEVNGTYNITDQGGQDYSDYPYMGELKQVPEWEVILKSLLFAVIIYFSLVGNFLIIVVVLRNRSMRTTTNYYIVNLAVADLLVTVCCMWVSLVDDVSEGWVLGAFFCKINTFTQVLSVVASVLSLTLIAYDRFFGIVFALKAHMTDRRARTSLILIWLSSALIACPTLIYRQLKVRVWKDHTERWCDDDWPVSIGSDNNITTHSIPSRTAYYATVSVVLYFIPMIVMTLAYSRIIMKLWMSAIPVEKMDKRVEAQARARKKVIVMLVAILVVFAVCWLPFQIILLYSELRSNREALGDWYYDLTFAARLMAYSNSALNPLIYTGFNENFRRGIQRVWHCVSCKEKPNVYNNGYSYGHSYGSHDAATMPTSL
ncbi:tachykinin-like peptides receptor 99D [Mytilus trossulus]|uniref:tachykinin-like peptides receptor 99D n=1 Tax=Mytilus trossulus TaxID=6551 RepID=UPI003005E4F3